MFKTRLFSFALASTLSLFLLFSTGCSSRAASAQKLFDSGQYQQVIDKYPDLEVARRAHAKLADDLLQKKDYSTVMRDYADTPAAYKARLDLAQKMFDEGRYQALLDSFPQSPLAATAKGKLADSLVAAGQTDKLLAWYPDTPQAKQVKETQATEELARIKKLPKKDKAAALEDFMKKFAGTETYKEAGDMLAKIRQADANQSNKKK
jgi:thioredoxin-like negative regulator of GroEL